MYFYVYKKDREIINNSLDELFIEYKKKGEHYFKSNTHTHSFRINYLDKLKNHLLEKGYILNYVSHSLYLDKI